MITDGRKCDNKNCYICRWSDKYKSAMASTDIEELRAIAIEAINDMEEPVTDAVYWKCKYLGTWDKECDAVDGVVAELMELQ